jgi:hypothetical protein
VSPGRTLLDYAAILAAVVLVLFALTSLPQLGESGAAVSQRDRARAVTATGDIRAATRAWLTVLTAAPRSTEALLNLGCLSWTAGYQEEAALYYERALAGGIRWDEIVIVRNCFVNAPRMHGLRMVDVHHIRPLLYVAPKPDDVDAGVLVAIATEHPTPTTQERYRKAIAPHDQPTLAQVVFAIGCLNDRAGARWMASESITLALNLNTEALPPTGALRDCLNRLPDRYGFTTKGGVEIFMPRDLGDRLFIPESSPIPAKTARILP